MQTLTSLLRRIYDTPACLALVPPLAVIIDYSLTFFLAGSTRMILRWEASPLVRFAVAHDLMALYLAGIVLFYYGASFAVLRILQPSGYYVFGAGLVILVGIIHVLGGLSWLMKTAWYSDSILALSVLAIITALCLFGYSLLHQEYSVS